MRRVNIKKYLPFSMGLKYKLLLLFICLSFSLHSHTFQFIVNESHLQQFYGKENVIMIASPGRSGSTLLTHVFYEYATTFDILKTHILPPTKQYKGKIIFIFSNPDKAAESALHLTIQNEWWGLVHFYNMRSSDLKWLCKIGGPTKQTIQDNILAYDALGYHKQLVEWLCKTKTCERPKAQILAIKYENLWDLETIQAMKDFLQLYHFELPVKQERGYKLEELTPQEILFKNTYNLGTEQEPIYQAYDLAREIWKASPAFQYLMLP